MISQITLACRTAAVFLIGASTAVASGGPVVGVPERLNGSRNVVVATAVAVTPEWRRNMFGDQLIISKVTLQIEETLKGAAARVMPMELEGGTLDGLTLHVSSLPTLVPGERAVFFLDESGDGFHVPHLQGLGILKLDANDQVRGSSLRLDDIRRMARGAR